MPNILFWMRRRLRVLGVSFVCLKVSFIVVSLFFLLRLSLGADSLVTALGHVAWPSAFVTASFLFKHQLSFLISRVNGFKGLGVELNLIDKAYQLSSDLNEEDGDLSSVEPEDDDTRSDTETREESDKVSSNGEGEERKEVSDVEGAKKSGEQEKASAQNERRVKGIRRKASKQASFLNNKKKELDDLVDFLKSSKENHYGVRSGYNVYRNHYNESLSFKNNNKELFLEKDDATYIVLKSWSELRSVVTELFKSKFPNHSSLSFMSMVDFLLEEGYIDQEEIFVIHMLMRVRNQIVHEDGVGLDYPHAKKYIETVYNVTNRLLNHLDNG